MVTFTNTSTGRSGTIQTWTVPKTTGYRIEAQGAQGGTANGIQGGKGARISGDFFLTEGEVIKILVGQQGVGGPNSQGHYSGGGGGGTFVTRSPHNTVASILVVAGGGGGGYTYSGTSYAGLDGLATANGGNGTGGVAGGANGAYGSTSNAGQSSGFASDAPSYGSTSYVSGGLGGLMNASWGNYSLHGGFGGGGGAGLPSGGGGGYSGGGSGTWSNPGGGGGGGSYNNGANALNESGIRTGHGLVVITELNALPDAPMAVVVSEGMEAVYPAIANWTHVDSDGDPQSGYQLRWRVVI